MSRRTLQELRVYARMQAKADRAAWEDAKRQRVACFVIDFIGGSSLGVAFGLAVFVWALEVAL